MTEPGPARDVIGFAHRGASAHAPENTLEAFSLALEMGARGLESDVWITADGVAVLDHDGKVVVDGVERDIAQAPRAALPAHVPTLDALYATCGVDYDLSLDVKDEAAAEETIAVATRAGAAERLWLCHWSWKTVARWRALSPAVHLVDSTRKQRMRTPLHERAPRMLALGIDALNLPWRDWRAEDVALLHEHGRQAWAWDLQEPEPLARLVALGIDAVFSDHVDRMLAAIAAGR